MIDLKTLFNDWEVSTKEGQDFFNEIERALEPLYQKALDRGYKLREVSHMISTEASLLESEHCLLRNHAAHKRGERPAAETQK